MTATAALFTRTWRAGAYTCELTVPNLKQGGTVHAVIEWSPSVPRSLNRQEMQEYRRGRDAAIAGMTEQLKIKAALVEV